MSRTYRVRHELPDGFVCLDGGHRVHPRGTSWGLYSALYWSQRPYTGDVFEPLRVAPWRPRMTRCGETKSFRQEYQRRYRARVRTEMVHERWEDIPRFQRTSGWLTG